MSGNKKSGSSARAPSVRRRTLGLAKLLLTEPHSVLGAAELTGVTLRTAQRILADAKEVGFEVVRCESGKVMLRT